MCHLHSRVGSQEPLIELYDGKPRQLHENITYSLDVGYSFGLPYWLFLFLFRNNYICIISVMFSKEHNSFCSLLNQELLKKNAVMAVLSKLYFAHLFILLSNRHKEKSTIRFIFEHLKASSERHFTVLSKLRS